MKTPWSRPVSALAANATQDRGRWAWGTGLALWLVGAMVPVQAQAPATLTSRKDQTGSPSDLAGQFEFSSASYYVTDNEYRSATSRNLWGALITVTRQGAGVGRVLVDYYTTNQFDLTDGRGSLGPGLDAGGSGAGAAGTDPIFSAAMPFESAAVYPAPALLHLSRTTAVPGLDYSPVSGTLVFDDYQMSASFVVPTEWNYYSTLFDRTLSNCLKMVRLVLANPRPAPEEDPGFIAPTLGSTSQAALGIVMVNQLSFNGLTNVPTFSLGRAHYRLDEFGRSGSALSNENTTRVEVLLPGGGPGTVRVHLTSGYRYNLGQSNDPGNDPSAFANTGLPLEAGSDYADEAPHTYPNTLRTDGSDPIFNGQDFTSQPPGNSFDLTFASNETVRFVYITCTNDSVVEFNEDIHVLLEPLSQQPGIGPNPMATVTILFDDQPAGAADREWNPENVSYSTPPFNLQPGANRTVYVAAIQPDQRALIGGEFTAYNGTPRVGLARLLPNGFLDTSFVPGLAANSAVYALALYPAAATNVGAGGHSGKILIGGAFTSCDGRQRHGVARLNNDGSLDDTFRPGLGANGPVYAIALQQDGQVLVAGDFTQFDGQDLNRLVRLNDDGTVDGSFQPGAGADGAIRAVVVRDCPTNIFLARAGFSNEGEDIAVIETGANQGVISLNHDFPAPHRLRVFHDLNPEPLMDATLTGTGVVPLSYGPGVSTQVKIVIHPQQSGLAAPWRYTATILPAFTNRTIFVAGDFATFDHQGCGGVARLLENGAPDPNFGTGAGAEGRVWSLVVQPDGKPLLGGEFSHFDSHPRRGLVRLNGDGSVDESFQTGAGFNRPVYALALQPDLKPVVGGWFTQYNSTRRMGVARLLTTGVLDTSFMDTAFNQFAGLCRNFSFESPGFVSTIALQADGNLLIGGDFTKKLGGNPAPAASLCWTRADKANRLNVARLIGTWGQTPTLVTNHGTPTLVAKPNPPQGPGQVEFLGGTYRAEAGAPGLAMSLRRLDGRLGTLEATLASDPYFVRGDEQPRSVATNEAWLEAFYTSTFFASGAGAPTPRHVGDTHSHELWVPILGEPIFGGQPAFNLSLTAVTGRLVLGGETIPLGAAFGHTAAIPILLDHYWPRPQLQPRLSPDGQALHLDFALSAGQSYVVETSGDLVHWTALITNSAVGWQGSFTASNLLARPYQFYRLRNP